jgi:hypothetical protein
MENNSLFIGVARKRKDETARKKSFSQSISVARAGFAKNPRAQQDVSRYSVNEQTEINLTTAKFVSVTFDDISKFNFAFDSKGKSSKQEISLTITPKDGD